MLSSTFFEHMTAVFCKLVRFGRKELSTDLGDAEKSDLNCSLLKILEYIISKDYADILIFLV